MDSARSRRTSRPIKCFFKESRWLRKYPPPTDGVPFFTDFKESLGHIVVYCPVTGLLTTKHSFLWSYIAWQTGFLILKWGFLSTGFQIKIFLENRHSTNHIWPCRIISKEKEDWNLVKLRIVWPLLINSITSYLCEPQQHFTCHL